VLAQKTFQAEIDGDVKVSLKATAAEVTSTVLVFRQNFALEEFYLGSLACV
jgi:hypothetical protein